MLAKVFRHILLKLIKFLLILKHIFRVNILNFFICLHKFIYNFNRLFHQFTIVIFFNIYQNL